MERLRSSWVLFVLLVALASSCSSSSGVKTERDYVSVVGDPGMRRDGLRVALEAWNFCNEVGHEAPGMGSPRLADCFDLQTLPSNHSSSGLLLTSYYYSYFLKKGKLQLGFDHHLIL